MVNQSKFWEKMRKQRCNMHGTRVVPAFTIQALQENTVAAKLPKFDLYKECPSKRSLFRKYYERGLFPVVLEAQGNGGQRIAWKVHSLEHLDYHFYLPLFFDGLTEVKKPYSFLVEQGITEMLEAGSIRILPVLPQLIIPIKKAFNTKVPEIVSRTLKMLQYLVRCENCIGEALVPYFRQILPIFNLFKERNDNRGDGIDISKQCSDIVADLIQETLEIFEQHGGEDAFINIKYIVPTYESCVRN